MKLIEGGKHPHGRLKPITSAGNEDGKGSPFYGNEGGKGAPPGNNSFFLLMTSYAK